MTKILLHSTISMNTKHFKLIAAVCPADTAWITFSAVDIRIHDHSVTGLQIFWIRS
jgi:hypothetical protein